MYGNLFEEIHYKRMALLPKSPSDDAQSNASDSTCCILFMLPSRQAQFCVLGIRVAGPPTSHLPARQINPNWVWQFSGAHTKAFACWGPSSSSVNPKHFHFQQKTWKAQGLDEALQAGRGGGSSRPPSPRPDRLNSITSLCLTPAFGVR